MQNIIDYVKWRGDLTFERDSFNEVDNLIFSMLAYLKLDEIVSSEIGKNAVTLVDVARRYKSLFNYVKPEEYTQFFRQIPELLQLAAESVRFRDVKFSGYINRIDHELSKQFSAITFSLNEGQHFIAFRGTDDTLAGWKEDLQMTFLNEVPAQRDAVSYFNEVSSKLIGYFYLGGHSKGGNLAVYAATKSDEAIQDRIISIYNNDGPGFQSEVIESAGYQNIKNKIKTMVPKSSVIGLLLEHNEEFKIVASKSASLLQHNAFMWDVLGTSFVFEKGLSKSSIAINEATQAWLRQLTMEERKEFVDALFEIIQGSGDKTFGEISENKIENINLMIKTYKSMPIETQEHLKEILALFYKENKRTFTNTISDDIKSLISKIKKPQNE